MEPQLFTGARLSLSLNSNGFSVSSVLHAACCPGGQGGMGGRAETVSTMLACLPTPSLPFPFGGRGARVGGALRQPARAFSFFCPRPHPSWPPWQRAACNIDFSGWFLASKQHAACQQQQYRLHERHQNSSHEPEATHPTLLLNTCEPKRKIMKRRFGCNDC